MSWTPATKQDVLDEIERGWVSIDPTLKVQLSSCLVDPYPTLVDRFDRPEVIFIVARINQRVAFFDDVEDEFGTADDVKGKLVNVALCGNIVLALRELQRLGLGDR